MAGLPMRALPCMLLSWVMMVQLASKVIAIPFLGTVLSLSIYPFVKRLGWKDLFTIFLIGQISSYVVSFDSVLFLFNGIQSGVIEKLNLNGDEISSWVLPVVFIIAIPYSASVQTVITKILSRFSPPKMIRRVGYI